MLTLPELFVSINSRGLQLVTVEGALALSGGPSDADLALALDHHRDILQLLLTVDTNAKTSGKTAIVSVSTHSKPTRCICDKSHRHVTDELAEPNWFKVRCLDCGQWVGLKPAPRVCQCPADKRHDIGTDARGYTRIECSVCGQFKGYRPPPPAPNQKGLRLIVQGQKPREKVVQAQPGLFAPLTAQSFHLLPDEEREADEMYEARGGMVALNPVQEEDECPF